MPTTEGTSGYVLTSAAGGTDPMTWTDPGALAVKWNSIVAPSGNQSLAMGANTSAWTFNSVGNVDSLWLCNTYSRIAEIKSIF